jgi:Ser/Thr protein kinase RdoA (MazF antagonist)
MLTNVERRRLAAAALAAYPLVEPRPRFIADGENVTFRVDAGGERFLLRLHRPRRHGRCVYSPAAVRSELQWLDALRGTLCVPEPVRTRDGALTTSATAESVTRVCSVLRWQYGRIHAASPRPGHLRLLGAAMARLHTQADKWTPPPGFVRIRWDWETFFGNTMHYGDLDAADIWDVLPASLRRCFDEVAARSESLMTALGDFGLIHADLHLDNALFAAGEVRLIDFDDCGYGFRAYELAVALWELRRRDDYPAFHDALCEGYAAHRRLPPGDLDAFIAVREVAFGLWYVGMSRVNSGFRANLNATAAGIERSLTRLLTA